MWAIRFNSEDQALYPDFSLPDEVKTSHPLWAILLGFTRFLVAIRWGKRQPPLVFNFFFFELLKFGFCHHRKESSLGSNGPFVQNYE